MNQVDQCPLILFVVSFVNFLVLINARAGDADPIYKACIHQCEKTGCAGEKCIQHCKFSPDGVPIDGPWYLQEPLYQRWKQWDCQGECRYHCMLSREKEREKAGDRPVKYHGKWPLQRVYGIQEPVSVAFSALNLAMQFHGWVSFFIIVNYKLPLKPNRKTYYEYTGLMHIYAILAMNSFLWSTVFHSRDFELTERLDYSSAVALVGFSLILALLRTFNVTFEATRVNISAPVISLVTTHISYLNLYELNYGLNMKMSLGMGITTLLIWAFWAARSRHPSRWKAWTVVIGCALSALLEIYDFPPYMGYVDAHALWHAITIPITFFWWSFIKDDAEYRTLNLIKKKK